MTRTRERAGDDRRTGGGGGGEAALQVVETVRVMAVAGIATGLVVVGLGSRLAMLLLRLTSPDPVRGRVSDDGFVIGRVTLSGSYQLLQIGAAVGVIGAAVHLLVAPWLLGPRWFRRFTAAAAAGAVAGSMLVHADGIDFTALQPTWLAVGLFVGLPALFAVAVGAAVDGASEPAGWAATGRRRWLLPLLLVACGPGGLVVLIPAAAATAVLVAVSRLRVAQRLRRSIQYALVVRAVWLSIAVSGLAALVNDIGDLA